MDGDGDAEGAEGLSPQADVPISEHRQVENRQLWNHSHFRDCLATSEITLKVGAQVILVRNLDLAGTQKLVNGSRGVIVDFVEYPPPEEEEEKASASALGSPGCLRDECAALLGALTSWLSCLRRPQDELAALGGDFIDLVGSEEDVPTAARLSQEGEDVGFAPGVGRGGRPSEAVGAGAEVKMEEMSQRSARMADVKMEDASQRTPGSVDLKAEPASQAVGEMGDAKEEESGGRAAGVRSVGAEGAGAALQDGVDVKQEDVSRSVGSMRAAASQGAPGTVAESGRVEACVAGAAAGVTAEQGSQAAQASSDEVIIVDESPGDQTAHTRARFTPSSQGKSAPAAPKRDPIPRGGRHAMAPLGALGPCLLPKVGSPACPLLHPLLSGGRLTRVGLKSAGLQSSLQPRVRNLGPEVA